MTDGSKAQALLKDATLRQVLDVLDARGAETRVVGGAIRNALMGLPVNDIDCATTALPHEVVQNAQAAGFKVVPTGIEHGTVTVITDQRPFEITTLRRDVATDGRRAEVAFGIDFREDAQRRDFTINALYLDKHGKIYDFTDGLSDINQGRVRFIGDAASRIREDYLRILRFFRFAADYGIGELDPAGLSACIQERSGLTQLSRERIRAEMMRILVTRRAIEIIGVLNETGLLAVLTAGIARLERFARCAASTTDPVTRLLGLVVAIPEDAERLRERLRLSNYEYERLKYASQLMSYLHGYHGTVEAKLLRQLVVQCGLQTVVDAVTVLGGRHAPKFSAAALTMLANYQTGKEQVPAFPLTGKHLAQMGVSPGPRMGRVLAATRTLWLEAECPTSTDHLQALIAEALKRQP